MAATEPDRRTEESRTKGARIAGDHRSRVAEELRQRYERGDSIRAIAGELGRSYGFVQGLLKESGVSLRGRGGATRGRGAAKEPGAPAEDT